MKKMHTVQNANCTAVIQQHVHSEYVQPVAVKDMMQKQMHAQNTAVHVKQKDMMRMMSTVMYVTSTAVMRQHVQTIAAPAIQQAMMKIQRHVQTIAQSAIHLHTSCQIIARNVICMAVIQQHVQRENVLHVVAKVMMRVQVYVQTIAAPAMQRDIMKTQPRVLRFVVFAT